ncbi:MAG: hypothetical protein MSS60_09285 [Clostridiales bacterium]|nr:hypothetical protein [Clostridiales bacterium]
MSGFAAKPGKEKKPVTSIPNTVTICSERETEQRDAFWAGALESASILLWIATHSPNPEQSPFR